MRYTVYSADASMLGNADSAQSASDLACGYLQSNPLQSFAYTVDDTPGYVYPFVRYVRASGGCVAFIGDPFKTLAQCLQGE
jgi:hypothetical protein